jgi:hypothetical protein
LLWLESSPPVIPNRSSLDSLLPAVLLTEDRVAQSLCHAR